MRSLLRELSLTEVPVALAAFGAVCSLLVALYSRSYFLVESFQFVRGRAVWEVSIKRGRLEFDNSPQVSLERQFAEELDLQFRNISRELPRFGGEEESWTPDPLSDPRHPELRRQVLRLDLLSKQAYRANRARTPAAFRSYALGPPIAGISLLCSAAIFACGYRTYRRLWLGYCSRCGYDLRASGAICPECGKSRPIEDTGSMSRHESTDKSKEATS